jgi:hypothetical protein
VAAGREQATDARAAERLAAGHRARPQAGRQTGGHVRPVVGGLAPGDGGEQPWTAFLTGIRAPLNIVAFDPATYATVEVGARRVPPFYARLPGLRAVVLDRAARWSSPA